MKIAIAGLMHESNAFAPGVTSMADFEIGGLDTGPALLARWQQAHHELGGFLAAAEREGFEAVPAFTAWAMPSGLISRTTYDHLLNRLLAALRGCGPVDGALLALHGAMQVEGLAGSADAHTAAQVRKWLGPDRPLVVTLDYHANVSPELADAADAVVVYQTYPHIDQKERGLRAGEIMADCIRQKVRPVTAIVPLPMLIHLLAQNTNREPVLSILETSKKIRAATPGLLELHFVAGFPYGDTPATGASVVAVASGDRAVAESAALQFANIIWELKDKLTAQMPEPAQAVALACRQIQWPTVLVDVGDNIGGGSAADSTVLAHEIIRQAGPPFWVILHDEAAVEKCVEAGVGHIVRLQAGGNEDTNSPPLDVHGRVRLIHDGRYEEPLARHGGVRFHDQGLTGVIETERGDTVICTSHRHAPFSLGQLTSLGLDPVRAKIIIVKAAVAFRAAYEPIAGCIMEVDTPGLTAANPRRFDYRNIRRPMLPLDDIHELKFN